MQRRHCNGVFACLPGRPGDRVPTRRPPGRVERREWSQEWDEAADTSDFTLDLTPALASELAHKIHELIESYRTAAPEGAQDVVKVRVHSNVFPTRPKAEGT
ncbi:hypothetical protein AB0H82_00380 [Streptomyces sp. NPDC050732]|uniref:hypothetical protein n=1 Tax=Streptomyces sp. NPDC050732 TaxID=3154632 RepID=UPI00341E3057